MKRRTSTIALATLLTTALLLPIVAMPAAQAAPKRVAYVSWWFDSGKYQTRITTMKPNGKGKKVVKKAAPTAPSKVFSSAQVSPDGKRLLFTKGEPGGTLGEGTIWVSKSNGKKAKQIVKIPGGVAYSASWSRDGKSIAFLTTKGNKTKLVVASANGKKRKTRAKAGKWKLFGPTWAPNGKQIMFSAPGTTPGSLRVATVKPKGGKKVKYLTPANEHWRAGGYAPNGKRIVILGLPVARVPMGAGAKGQGPVPRRAIFSYNVSTVKANGKGPKKRLSMEDDLVTGRAVYSPDGRQVLAPRSTGGSTDIYAIPTKGGSWKRLTTTATGGTSMFDLVVLEF